MILTATSGDTGKAAMAGFADVEGTRIIVFYPKDGVSEVQKLQMITQKGSNVAVSYTHLDVYKRQILSYHAAIYSCQCDPECNSCLHRVPVYW